MSSDYLYKSVDNKSNSFSNEMKVKEVQLKKINLMLLINGIQYHLEIQI